MSQTHLLDLSQPQLTKYIINLGQPKFRAKQIWSWLYQHHIYDVEAMTNLPMALRVNLQQSTILNPLKPIAVLESNDGYTQKALFALSDGKKIETVLMRYEKRRTLCISTQAGCAMACPFCATGQMGFQRNLSTGEIVAQVLYYAHQLSQSGKRVTNIVFMGMGEPLANYKHTWQAIRRLNDPLGFNLGARQMTVSTVGLVPAINRLANEPEQVGLAVSLHAPTDDIRNQLVPINRRYPLTMLLKACRQYIEKTHRRITFEYALMAGWNDHLTQANQLATLLQPLLCHINLIPLNPTPDSPFRGSSEERVVAFQKRLQSTGISTTVRLRRGIDIQAGCGQLQVNLK